MSSVPTGPSTPAAPGYGRFLATVGGAVGLVLAVGLIVVATRWSSIPEVVASHWGRDGVDGTSSRGAYLRLLTGLTVGLPLGLALLARAVPADGRRLLAAVCGAVVVLVAAVGFGGLAQQAGLTDPRRAPDPWPLLVGGLLLGLVVGAVLWRLNPPAGTRRRPGTPPPADAPRLPDGGEGRLAWVGHASPSPAVSAVVGGALLVVAAVVALLNPWGALVPVVVGLGLLVALHATVTVDERGLRVASGFSTWLHVPLDQVTGADTTTLSPLKEFGGYGLRYGTGKRGYVVSAGEALVVHQADGTTTYVTTVHADRAAATLNTLLARLP